MKQIYFWVFTILALCIATLASAQNAQIVTLTSNTNLIVQPNQIISLVGYDWSDAYVNVSLSNKGLWADMPNGNSLRINPYGFSIYSSSSSQVTSQMASSSQIPQVFTGVTNIYFLGIQNAWATFKIETPSTATTVSNYVPADAIVIPASATGNVQIILESSPDLVNWTAASPGTYGESAGTNRFFRVRAAAN